MSQSSGSEILAFGKSRLTDAFVIFLDPGSDTTTGGGTNDPQSGAIRDEWRAIHAAVADVTIDAQVPDPMPAVDLALAQLPTGEPARLPAVSSQVPLPAVANGSTPDVLHKLASQWEAHGWDPQVVELVHLLRYAAMHTRTESDVVLAGHGLTREFFDVMAALYRASEDEALTQAQLADQMFVTQAGMMKRLRRLKAMGFVARRADVNDARRYLLALTDDGRSALETVLKDFFAAEAASLSGLPDDEQKILIGLLQRLLSPNGA